MSAADRLGAVGRTVALIVLGVGLVTVLGVFFYWPITAIIGRGITAGADVLGVLGSPRTSRVIRQTLIQAGCATAVTIVVGLPGAHILYRRSFRGRTVIRSLLAVPFVLPTVVVGVAIRSLLAPGGWLGSLGLDHSIAAIVFGLVFFNYSVFVRTVGSYWACLSTVPEDAARCLGAGPWRVWWTVTFPRLLPVMSSAVTVVFLFCATAFGVVMTLGGAAYGTLETEIWMQTTQFFDIPTAAVLSVLQLVMVAVLLFASRLLGRRAGPTGHAGPALGPRGVADGLAVTVTAIVAACLVLPMLSLVIRSVHGTDGWTTGNYTALLEGNLVAAFATSLRTAVVAAAIALVLGVGVVIVARRSESRLRRISVRILDVLVTLPLGVSAVTVGFGLLITVAVPALSWGRQWWLVPVAQSLVALPLVVRTLLPLLDGVDPRRRDAARLLGSPPWRVFIDIDARALMAGAGAATAFALATSLGEFGATSFLARPDAPTVPVLIYRLISKPGELNAGMAMAASVLLALTVTAVMVVLDASTSRRIPDGAVIGE